MGDHSREDTAGMQPGKHGVQGGLLGPAAGEAGPEDAPRFLQSCDLKTDRLAHPGENGDLPGGALCNAQRGLLPGRKPVNGPTDTSRLWAPSQSWATPSSTVSSSMARREAVAGGAGGLVFRCM